MVEIKNIFENNAHWIADKLLGNKDYFKNLAQGQQPEFLYIGCSDSRVTAEDLMGVQPGEAFIHRNIANLVNGTDLNVMSVIEYAVKHLKVKHIVVCGHYHCGGVKAAMESDDMGLLNPWLGNIKDVYRIHKDELNKIAVPDKRYDRLVELNVQEQCINLLKLASVQEAYRESEITVHGWVFDIETGKLIDLKIDFPTIIAQIRNIYRLD